MTTSNVTSLGPKLGQGNILVKLGEEEYELRPTINAMQTLSQRYGGLQEVIEKISKLDFNTIMDVMITGLGPRYQGARPRQQLAEKVFEAGLTDDTGGVAERCQMYVIMLMRGGRPLNKNEDIENDESTPEGNAKSSS